MKKLISTVLALGMAASLAACGSSASSVHGREHRGIYRSSRGQ